MQKTIQILKQEISRQRLYRMLREISSHHRIQTTQGYRDAAASCVRLLHQHGISARVLSYPMKERTYAGSYRLFPQWNCRGGYCRVVEPEEVLLADYDDDPIQIITQSIAGDYRDRPLSIVDMDRGSAPEAYPDMDWSGKLLFTHEPVKKYSWAFALGAVGLISDYLNETEYVRTPEELLDTRNYTGFWWPYAGEEKGFGYVISPRLSLKLKELCRRQQERFAKGESETPYPQAIAYMDSEIIPGNIEVVEAVLEGQSEECILLCAHLCHPYASANDNASGVSAAMETLIALKHALASGKLAPLKKSVRLILVPEFTGTYHYFNDGRDARSYLAGINLDMVGAKQEDTTGPITVTHLPYAAPSIAGEVASLLLEEIKLNVRCEEDVILRNVKTHETAFGLGSDHFILSDPQLNIPSVMLGQWPDKYYHTSSDTIERMDMHVLKFSTVLAASYAYTLANLTAADVDLLFLHQRARCMRQAEQIERMARLEGHEPKQLEMELSALREFHLRTAESVKVFLADDAAIAVQQKRLARLLEEYDAAFPVGGAVYRRRYHDPIETLRSLFLEDAKRLAIVDEYEARFAQAAKKALCETLCGYYIDGKRGEAEIIARTCAEAGVDASKQLQAYLRVLYEVGLIEEVV